MIYKKPAWFLEVRMIFRSPHMLLNITFVRVCIVAYITLTPYWKIYKYAPVVFWFAVRLEMNIRKNKLLFSLVAKKYIYTHHYELKSWFFGLGGGVRVFTFLFHLLYIYECICIWVWGSTIPPLSRSPHLYSDLTPLLSRISPSSPSIPSLNFIGSATFLWTLRCVFRLVLRTDKRLN